MKTIVRSKFLGDLTYWSLMF